MKPAFFLLQAALMAACHRQGAGTAGGAGPGRLDAVSAGRVAVRVQYTPRDSTPFGAATRGHRCGGGGFLLDGADQGNGILVWLRSADSGAAGTYPILSRWDTLTRRGAVVAIRFVIGDMAHGVALDSGSAVVTAAGAGLAVRVVGAGLEAEGARKVHAEARFGATALASDTVPCRVRW